METSSNDYHRGLELAEAGKYQEALACLEEHLRTTDTDADVLNDIGTILHCLRRSNEAIDHFIRARGILGDSAEVIWNLAEAYLSVGEPDKAMPLFDSMERMGILNADLLNRTANACLDKGDKAGALEMLLRSLQIAPDQKILSHMINVIRGKRPRIAFFCGGNETVFFDKIKEFTEKRFFVRIFNGQTADQAYELMKLSDICWFEPWPELIAEVSKRPKVCKMIVRLSQSQANQDWLSEVNWENIDTLIVLGDNAAIDGVVEKVPTLSQHTELIHIAGSVEGDRFKFTEKDRGKNIACVANLAIRKNPTLLLLCMQKLNYLDIEYRLHFAGHFQDTTVQQYIRHTVDAMRLSDVIIFDGWQNDMNAWLSDKHYIVACDAKESTYTSVLEAMTCGLKPVIHNSPSAAQIFPSEFLFNITEDFCDQILSNNYQPQRYREFAEEAFPLKSQLSEIDGVFVQFETEIDQQSQQGCADDRAFEAQPAAALQEDNSSV